MGVDPRPFTFHELEEMFIARQYWEWARTAQILSAICAFGGTNADLNQLNPFSEAYGLMKPKIAVSAKDLYSLLTEHAEFKKRWRN